MGFLANPLELKQRTVSSGQKIPIFLLRVFFRTVVPAFG